MHILLGTKHRITRQVCQEVATGLSLKMCVTETLEDFLLILQENNFITAIIDLALGPMDPVKVVRLIHRIRPKVPIIALTKTIDKHTGGELYSGGVNFLCHSPPNFETIYSAVSATLKFSTREKQY